MASDGAYLVLALRAGHGDARGKAATAWRRMRGGSSGPPFAQGVSGIACRNDDDGRCDGGGCGLSQKIVKVVARVGGGGEACLSFEDF